MKKILLIAGIFSFSFFWAQKSENYLQIRYGSICCGTPSTDPVMNYVKQFQKKNKIKNLEIYKQSGLGREGEFHLYIGTDSFSKKQALAFTKGLQSAIETQNNARKKNHDGTVGFDETQTVKKTDLSNARNLTIYKK
ncbi:hypothetical protein [Chryseobacterium limigenitum]|uniref:Uncharacterized protein n=1 Tax=Chryseobacterium limigenitum TaxID=1612149 RepID=A0A1K2IV57_9FLAO|nr:hypothetical protein [Chryseobacterium limigenitum]SFZ95627.1 hypothetical protein SAMN05216324_11182 [Chryseobacterium limigenitum]